MAVKGAKALEVWARRVTDGYPGVRITNMSSAWKDGMAFCALVHKFRPDLIDFHSLDPAQIERNCRLVFDIAEAELGIPSLLDPVDMAECKSPDRLSILTYLSEFYHKFKAEKSQEGSPEVNKKEENGYNKSPGPCPDLKRKDSCDSGVSVSPLGSVCNSPPCPKKEKATGEVNEKITRNNEENETKSVTANNCSSKQKDEKHSPLCLPVEHNPLSLDSSVSSSIPTHTSTSSDEDKNSNDEVDKDSFNLSENSLQNIVQSPDSSPSSLPPSISSLPPYRSPCLSDGSSGLEKLLHQRLQINSGIKITTKPNCHQRRSLLNSMISISPSSETDAENDSPPDTSLNNNTERMINIKKENRRHTLGGESSSLSPFTVTSSCSARKGNVFNITQNFNKSCQDSNKFVSKTTIKLCSNPPITYSPNNSVTCDIKSPPTNNVLHPRPWRQNLMTESMNSAVVTDRETGQLERLQVKVGPSDAQSSREEPRAGTNLIVIKPNEDSNLEGLEKSRDKNKTTELSSVKNNVKSTKKMFEMLMTSSDTLQSGDDQEGPINSEEEGKRKEIISINGKKGREIWSDKIGLKKAISLPNKMFLAVSDQDRDKESF